MQVSWPVLILAGYKYPAAETGHGEWPERNGSRRRNSKYFKQVPQSITYILFPNLYICVILLSNHDVEVTLSQFMWNYLIKLLLF